MRQSSLFPDLTPSRVAPPLPGPYAGVAIEQAVDRLLTYAVPADLAGDIAVGQRVRVPLGRGNKPAYGYVVRLSDTTDHKKIKPLLAIADERVLVNPKMMELARWIGRYYLAPLGMVLDSIIPSAVKKRIGLGYSRMVRAAKPREALQAVLETTKAPKRRAVLARLLLVEDGETIEITRLAAEAGTTPGTVRALKKLGLIELSTQPDLQSLTVGGAEMATAAVNGAIDGVTNGAADGAPDRTVNGMPDATADTTVNATPDSTTAGIAGVASSSSSSAASASPPPEPQPQPGTQPQPLNDDQQHVYDQLLPRLAGGFSVNLLMGVTGSGKTEIYLRCIEQVVRAGRAAIVLVPEIALTPQTVRRFTQRFARVAVLHSGLTNTQRHQFWQQVSTRAADVVVGARSAVFAPTPRCGIIVVDEEHESSYKQDQIPRYHARDVAIKRAQLESIPVLLGSATPSLEMYERATRAAPAARPAPAAPAPPADDQPAVAEPAAYHLLTLPRRVRGLSLPKVELIDLGQARKLRRGIHLLTPRLEHLLKQTLAAKQQAILLLNRRGYANFIYCAHCQEAVQCKYCDATMTYHRSASVHLPAPTTEAGVHTGQMHCHYCLAVNALPANCPTCLKKLALFGLGTQRVEEELERKFPGIVYARVDSDTMRNSRDYDALLTRFGNGEVQVMLGTQMIAKGLDYPNVTLVGVISGDTALALPDFRASERTFQLITQVAGRAGRGDLPGRVILQTFLPDDPAINAAISQDYVGFATTELAHRRSTRLPPFGRLVRIVTRDEDEKQLAARSADVAARVLEAVQATGAPVDVKGPMPCAIARIAGFHRSQLVLHAQSPAPLQRVLALVRDRKGFTTNDRIAVDVDPVSLL